MTDLDMLAREVDTSSRTLRRAAARGAIRCRRPSDRRIVVPPREYDYVRRHWDLLARLVEELRTQPNVRLALLYGSLARGDEREASDVDVLISLGLDGAAPRAALSERLEVAAGRRVQLVGLAEAERSPLLLSDILRDGRVLVDRDGGWSLLKQQERAVQRRARAAERRLDADAWRVLKHLDAV